MIVKICGIKTVEAARVAASAGTDFIGFIFAESSRKIDPETAAEIAKELPAHIKKVGVFSNQTESEITEYSVDCWTRLYSTAWSRNSGVCKQDAASCYKSLLH